MAEAVLPRRSWSTLADRLARACEELSGWRRLIVAVLLGASAALALPPLHIVILLWPAFTGLLWLLNGARRMAAALAIGWAFGFGYFIVGLYWVGIAFLVDVARHGWLMPIAVGGLAAGMALFPMIAVGLVQASRARGWVRLLVLAAAWLFAEWLRSWILTGFPWNMIGTVWAFSAVMIQGAALFGLWGLGLATVILAGLPALLRDAAGRSNLAGLAPLLCPLVLLALMAFGGLWRLASAPLSEADLVPGVTLRLVQPSIEQALKWRSDLRRQHLDRHIALTRGAGFEKITHVVWPETAVPFDLSGSRELQSYLGQAVPEGGLLITGAPRRDEQDGTLRIFNSLHALGSGGELLATYDKVHLVPFGEYVPLGRYLRAGKLTDGRLDFSPGPGPTRIALSGLPAFGPLICYEVIFPGRVVAAGARPDFLLSVTNDAWFGRSSGPYQHFAAARLRAVEEGLPMVRAANNGISAVIDGYGRVLARSALNDVGVIDAGLPRKVVMGTVFSKFGNWVVLTLIIVFICPLLFIRLL